MMVDNAGSTHSDKFATNGLASESSSGSLMGRDAMGIEDRADGSTATMGIASYILSDDAIRPCVGQNPVVDIGYRSVVVWNDTTLAPVMPTVSANTDVLRANPL